MHPLHFGVNHDPVRIGDLALSGVLVLAGTTSLLVVGLAVAALARRRSRSYLLIAAALATLLGRTVAGWLAMGNVLLPDTHHLIEHGLDGVMALLLIAAVYYARTAKHPARAERT